jgi:hypothetical protein
MLFTTEISSIPVSSDAHNYLSERTNSHRQSAVPRQIFYLLVQNSWKNKSSSVCKTLHQFLSQHPKGRDGYGQNTNNAADAEVTAASDQQKQHGQQQQQQQHNDKENDLDCESMFYYRTFRLRLATDRRGRLILPPWAQQSNRQSAVDAIVISMALYILPAPKKTFLDMTFTALVLRYERTMLKKQSLTAWLATLGGGFFFIKQLSKSLHLARQQRLLALQIGNDAMARHCLLNEAYNLIYAGKFQEAKHVLTTLEEQVLNRGQSDRNRDLDDHDIHRTLRQCQAARILLRRLKKLSNRLGKYNAGVKGENRTVDDYQRVRIVDIPSKTGDFDSCGKRFHH